MIVCRNKEQTIINAQKVKVLVLVNVSCSYSYSKVHQTGNLKHLVYPGPRDNRERMGLGHREDIVEGSHGKVVQPCRDDGCRTCPRRPQGSELK